MRKKPKNKETLLGKELSVRVDTDVQWRVIINVSKKEWTDLNKLIMYSEGLTYLTLKV